MSLADRASQAVEELIEAREKLPKQISSPARLSLADRLGVTQREVREASSEEVRRLRLLLNSAEPFWWERQITEMVRIAAASLPDWTLRPELLPTRSGFFYFATPLPLPGVVTNGLDGALGPLRAIAWVPRSADFVELGYFVNPLGFTGLIPCYYGGIRFGRPVIATQSSPIDDLYRNGPRDEEAVRQAERYFGACLLFLEQRIAVSGLEDLDRTARRRFDKVDIEYPPLRVIRLRTTTKKVSTDESEPEDWQYRWLVRGHWRQQFFPSDHSHRPVWVTPYVKGPDDKPLKAPAASVFAVVR